MTRREASRETLERLWGAIQGLDGRYEWHYHDEVQLVIDQLRAETRPLRTRSEVDREIGDEVRLCTRSDGKLVDSELLGKARRLCALIREPTQDSGPGSQDESCDGIEVIIHDHGSAFGCISLGDIRKACQLLHARVTVDCCGVGAHTMQYLRDNGIGATPMRKPPRCKP